MSHDPHSQAKLPQPSFDRFYKHTELTQLLEDYAKARPDLVELRELGRSYENRPIWILVLTRKSTGTDTDKPAFWVDGNIHAAELTASTSIRAPYIWYLDSTQTAQSWHWPIGLATSAHPLAPTLGTNPMSMV